MDTVQAFSDQRWRIKSLSDAVQTEIEAEQPYNRPHDQVPPLLSILREFDDADKHRLLNVIVSAQFEGEVRNLNVPIPPGQSINMVWYERTDTRRNGDVCDHDSHAPDERAV